MLYLIGLLLLLLIITLLFVSKRIEKTTKLFLAGIIALVVLLGVGYTVWQKRALQQQQENYAAFMMGQSIYCDGVEVNSSRFTYSEGTRTFIGKKDSNVFTKMISLKRCSK